MKKSDKMIFVLICIIITKVKINRLGELQMKRMKLVLFLFVTFSLTGCMQKINMSEQQKNTAAEYMAGLLLKYDTSYKSRLVSAKDIEVLDQKEEKVEKVEKVENEQDEILSADNNVATPSNAPEEVTVIKESENRKEMDYTLTDVVGVKDFEVEYTEYKVVDTYPDDQNTYFVLPASEGKQLLVTYFFLNNKSNSDTNFNLTKSDIKFKLDVNTGLIYHPIYTVLDNDLQFIDVKVGGGKKETVVLLFEIPKGIDLTDLDLTISNNDKTEIIKMK